MKPHTACRGPDYTHYVSDGLGALVVQPCEGCEEERREYEARIAKEKAEREAKARRQAIVDAANLRVLAALIEESKEPLSDYADYNHPVTSSAVTRELSRRIG